MPNSSPRFEGSASYVATEDLQVAVNAAVALERPLLVKGEPGTGKTVLAHEVADVLGLPLIPWHIKSTTKAQHGLYEYDAVARLRDSQLGSEKVQDVRNYIQFPDEATMVRIVESHFPKLKQGLVNEALALFYGLREVQGLKKKPSTSELLDWLRLLVLEDADPDQLGRVVTNQEVPPLLGALVKNEQDIDRIAEHLRGRRR